MFHIIRMIPTSKVTREGSHEEKKGQIWDQSY